MLTTHTIDGFTFDLTHPWADVYEVHWTFTGNRDHRGMPLMTDNLGAPIPLDEVQAVYGPLIPVRTTDRSTFADVLRAPYPGDDQVAEPLPVRPVLRSPADPVRTLAATTATAPAARPLATSPPATPAPGPVPTPFTLARLLGRLRALGGRR
ncbi:phiSA1p31-related protein [Streptomyces sp. C10-9-1]|uniref:phiSA1p31-related protein n=1 Tax=Streptomyces sp. C10-9-1 TaxID=1859285 RepID=UPI003F4A3344